MGFCSVSQESGEAYDFPPIEIEAVSSTLYRYLFALHVSVFGVPSINPKGTLDVTRNVTIDHGELDTSGSYDHHGAGDHKDLDQALSVADGTASTVSVDSSDAGSIAASDATSVTAANATAASGTADATYSANEVTLINDLVTGQTALVALTDELKTSANELVTLANEAKADYNAAVTLINELKTDVNTLVANLNSDIAKLDELLSSMRDSKLLGQ